MTGPILWPEPYSPPYQNMSGGNFVVRPTWPKVARATVGEREEVVVARNVKGYVKGLCIYATRDHATYGRLIDVPLFIASSAVDGEGVTGELINFLRSKCDQSVCSGIRFWAIDGETWAHRLNPDYIARSDHGLFLPALASTAGIMKALRAQPLSVAQAIDRLSR